MNSGESLKNFRASTETDLSATRQPWSLSRLSHMCSALLTVGCAWRNLSPPNRALISTALLILLCLAALVCVDLWYHTQPKPDPYRLEINTADGAQYVIDTTTN